MNSPAHLSLSSSEQMGKNKPCVMCCNQPSLSPARNTGCTQGRAGQQGCPQPRARAVASPPLTAAGVSACTVAAAGTAPRHPWLSRDTGHSTLPQTAFHVWLNIARFYHNLKAAGKEIFLSWQLQFFFNSPSLEKQAKTIFASAPHIPLKSEMTSVLTHRYFYI